jgi:hypothetical protein
MPNSNHEVETYIMPDDEVLKGFCAVAPIIKDPDQYAHAMSTPQGLVNLRIAFLYFALGARFAEHVQNHHEWLAMLSNALDPQHPQTALPGFDFPLDNLFEEIKARLAK